MAQDDSTEEESLDVSQPDEGEKALLNRRGYLKLGSAAVGVTLGTGGLVSTSVSGASETFATDFSEYSQ